MVQIKICGLTQKKDVNKAVSLGTHALGFILATSPRKITLKKTAQLTKNLPPFVCKTAVVVNPSPGRLQEIIHSRLFERIQFHGQESPELLKRAQKQNIKVIKALSIAEKKDFKEINKYRTTTDFFLFDTKFNNKTGGTGETFDWSLLKNKQLNKPFILAGGLGPQNIEKALTILQPPAVDINSKIEEKPGEKNHELMEKFFRKLKAIEQNIKKAN